MEVFPIFEIMQKSIYKLKEKKGVSTIEIVIGMLIFLIALCFLTDLLMLLWKFSVIGHTTTQVARLTGIQGGALTSSPPSWPGGNANYTTISDVQGIVEDKFQSAGIASNEWNMSIERGSIGSGGTKASERIDYTENFEVVTTVDYRWDFVSNILPIDLNQTITAKRPAMSEWKYNYDNWEGE